jgi:16S rRNA G527 N7-methylase RsmG
VAAELCLPFTAISGVVVLLKGADAHPEIAAANPLIERLGGHLEASKTRHLPTTDRRRLLAVIRKVRPCGPEFPRNARHLGQTTA